MNDRYLFRGKRVDNGEWIFGSLLCGDGYCEIAVRHEDDPLMTRHEVDPATVGAFTTLTDKNGVRIWEGSLILFADKYVYEVRWENGTWVGYHTGERASWGRWGPISRLYDLDFNGYDFRVIGSIHDTPVEDNKTESNEKRFGNS